MLNTTDNMLIERGLQVAESRIFRQNKIWARHADEKPDVAASLMRTIRELHRRLPPDRDLSALSIGSGDEPQFRLLEATFQNGLCLYDLDAAALAVVRERIERQMIERVTLAQGDFNNDFRDADAAELALAAKLGGRRFDLLTLHHCLYYSDASNWPGLISALYESVLAPSGAMHMAMMSAREDREGTTTWLYNHFTEKFFGSGTNQDLLLLEDDLAAHPSFKNAQILSESSEVRFWVDNFERYMAVVWMIMLYPDGHRYTVDQRVEIIEFVIQRFWRPRRPLVQVQDYLTVFKAT
ncbi:hypothetical protein [Hoeflea sp.]|uniref:hypothetical protein n=1 Tax=Hoeflea sp. TaxID=1940281 RepID=UPI003B01484B